MKYLVLVLSLIASFAIFPEKLVSQTSPPATTGVSKTKPKSTPVKRSSTRPKNSSFAVTAKAEPTPVPLTEKEQFEKASGFELAADRVAALEKFLTDFPESTDRAAAADLLAGSRVLIAEEKLLSGDADGAVAIYRRVIEDAPQPFPNELFFESISRVPVALLRRGLRPAATEIALLIESKVENDGNQLAELSNYYLALENGAEAMRVAAKAAAKSPSSPAVYRALALAHRVNFDLELSADAYAKAVELEPDSAISKRGLADMKRALGKSDEAAVLYRELLSKNASDVTAQTGLVLSLFDGGKRSEAEAELAKALESAPGNIVLLSGAAYWYASRGIGDKAVELAQKAVDREPRYVWSHIALARGLMSQGKPVAAEQVLVKARTYGNFPTLEYELASARAAAGFFREAAEDLSKHFSASPTGVRTRLGGRLPREEKSLTDLVAYERKASIFAPSAADTPENAETLKGLLELHQAITAAEPNEAEIAAAADAFTKASDKMKLHRQVYAAELLLENRQAYGKVLELTKAATGKTDAALDVPDPAAAVMASQLYEARSVAFRRNDFLLVPEVPRATLSAILRGRIEELSGWALYQQNNYPDSIVRLRRAITVIPVNSAWWRSSLWRLGAALAADGKDTEALDSYISSYKTDKPDYGKYTIVEALYKKVHGSTDGLADRIGADHVAVIKTMPDLQTPPTQTATPAVETPAETQPAEKTTTVTPEPTNDPGKTDLHINKKPLIEEKPPVSDPVAVPTPQKTLEVKGDVPKVVDETPKEISTDPKPIEPKIEPETKPAETKPIEIKTEEPEIKPPDPKPAEESKPPDQATGKPQTPETKTVANKPLFEPIVITIPSSRPAKLSTSETTEKKTDGAARPRVIVGHEVKIEDPVTPCEVVVSQENVSLINNGGNVGLLVNIEGQGDIKSLKAVSSSEKDIEITLEPEIGGLPDRRFFVIKSISTAVGVYQVTFTVPCGKKEVVVNVR